MALIARGRFNKSVWIECHRNHFDPPCGFSKNVSSKERVKPWFFMTFNIIIRHTFPENFIEILQVVQKL